MSVPDTTTLRRHPRVLATAFTLVLMLTTATPAAAGCANAFIGP